MCDVAHALNWMCICDVSLPHIKINLAQNNMDFWFIRFCHFTSYNNILLVFFPAWTYCAQNALTHSLLHSHLLSPFLFLPFFALLLHSVCIPHVQYVLCECEVKRRPTPFIVHKHFHAHYTQTLTHTYPSILQTKWGGKCCVQKKNVRISQWIRWILTLRSNSIFFSFSTIFLSSRLFIDL